MASKKNLQNPAIEVAGIVLIGFAIFLSCCLLTYYPDDPSFSTGYSQLPEKISNLGGLVGVICVKLAFSDAWSGCIFNTCCTISLSIKILYDPDFPYIFYVRLFLYILLIVCIQTLMSLYIGRLDFYRYNFDAGGIVGSLLSGFLTGYLNVFGAYLLLVIMLLLIIMVITRVSYVHLWKGISDKVFSRIKMPSGRFCIIF